MVVKIRLARWGARHNPFYGIVVANARAPRDGKHLERVGTYNPIPDPKGVKHLELNTERIKYWIGVGAQPTERVSWLLSKLDIVPPTPTHLHHVGELNLGDSSTWNLKVTDHTGQELELVTNRQTEKFDELKAIEKKKPRIYNNRLDFKKITLNGVANGKLEPQDATAVLKAYVGI
ncbi:ribosomal protein S16 domain-containing protein [Globomyces pollinis-pini]|nr:ribosomal protein S16 domain-containing protein [Globomyces pollinis-pini]